MGAYLELIPPRWLEYEPPSNCHDFGLSEILIPVLAGTIGETAAATAAPIAAGALEGAGIGAAGSAITGGDPGIGALTGGITGGAIPAVGPAIGEAAGIGTMAGDVLAGAGAGTLAQAITGGDPLTGAVTGGAGGLISGAFGPTAPTSAPLAAETSAIGGGPSAVSTTAGITPPAGSTLTDLTSGIAGGGAGANYDPFMGQDVIPGQNIGSSSRSWSVGNAESGVAAMQKAAMQGYDFTAPATSTTGSVSTAAGEWSPRSEFGDWSARPGGSVALAGTGDIGSKVMGLIEKNPGVVLGAGLLGANMLMGNKPLPAEKEIQRIAGEAQTMGRTMAAYQQSGTLPPGLTAIVDQQVNAAKAELVSKYGAMGMGNSTMLVDKINALKVQRSAEIAAFADNLAKQGLDWTKMSATEFNALLNAQAAQEEGFAKSLGLFASGLAGMRPSAQAA